MEFKRLTVGDAFGAPIRGAARFTRAYLRDHPGEYPVYSGSTSGPIGYADSFDLEGDYLGWSIDGYAGRLMVHSGRFSGTTHRGFLAPKLDNLVLEYCELVLAPVFRAAARGRLGEGKVTNEYTALPMGAVRDLEFEVPVDATGALDPQAQLDVVARMERLRSFQRRAGELIGALSLATPTPSLDGVGKVAEVSLLDGAVFQFVKSETGWFKKDWIGLSRADGAYPVYSAAKGPVTHVDLVESRLIDASPEAPLLSFAVDGDGSAGTNFVVHERPFYISTNRAAFRVVDENVDLEYIRFALQTMKANYGFSYNYKAYASRLGDVVVRLPLAPDGGFDRAVQLSEVNRLKALIRLREEVTEVLRNLRDASLTAM